MIYLASPYSSGSNKTKEDLYNEVSECFEHLLGRETPALPILCPIAMSHALDGKMPPTHEWWLTYDVGLLKKCDELWVCCLDGWRESTGVLIERCVAQALDLPIRYVHQINGVWIISDHIPE